MASKDDFPLVGTANDNSITRFLWKHRHDTLEEHFNRFCEFPENGDPDLKERLMKIYEDGRYRHLQMRLKELFGDALLKPDKNEKWPGVPTPAESPKWNQTASNRASNAASFDDMDYSGGLAGTSMNVSPSGTSPQAYGESSSKKFRSNAYPLDVYASFFEVSKSQQADPNLSGDNFSLACSITDGEPLGEGSISSEFADDSFASEIWTSQDSEMLSSDDVPPRPSNPLGKVLEGSVGDRMLCLRHGRSESPSLATEFDEGSFGSLMQTETVTMLQHPRPSRDDFNYNFDMMSSAMAGSTDQGGFLPPADLKAMGDMEYQAEGHK